MGYFFDAIPRRQIQYNTVGDGNTVADCRCIVVGRLQSVEIRMEPIPRHAPEAEGLCVTRRQDARKKRQALCSVGPGSVGYESHHSGPSKPLSRFAVLTIRPAKSE